MKAEELTPCAICGNGLMQNNALIFYRVTIATCGINLDAVRRRQGEEMMMGPLAAVIGRQEDIAQEISNDTKIVCMNCLVSGKPMALLLEGE